MKRRHKYFKLRSLRRSRRGMLTAAAVLVAVFGIALLFTYEKLINYYAYDLLGKTLRRTVEIKTDRFYSISYDSIHVDFLDSKATLYDFRVTIDSAQLALREDDPSLFVAYVPKAEANIHNLFEIIFSDRVRLEAILLKNPEVWIAQPRTGQASIGLSKESGDIYKKVTEQIREFNLGSFGLENARINYKREITANAYSLVINNISFVIQNFGWNKDDEDSDFHSDHIRLNVKDQTFNLRDSIHMVAFDSVYLSTEEAKVDFVNVNVLPRNDMLSKRDGQEKNAYSLVVPSLSLTGVDFNKAYRENMLAIDRIGLTSPIFAMDNFTAVEKGEGDEEKNSDVELMQIIAQLFNVIEVNDLDIEDGDVNILRARKPSVSRFKAKNIFAHVKNVRLDTLNYSELKYDSAIVGLKDYYYSLPDSIHILKFGSLSFTTTDKSNIKIDSLKVFDRLTDLEKRETGGVLNMVAPKINISGFEFDKFIDENELLMSNIAISSPDIKFYTKNTKQANDSTDVPTQVGKIFDVVHADSIKLDKGSVVIYDKRKRLLDIENLNAQVGEIINQEERTNLYLDSIDVTLKADRIKLSVAGGVAGTLNGLSVEQNDNAGLFIENADIQHKNNAFHASLRNIQTPLSGLSALLNNPIKALDGLKVRDFDLDIEKSAFDTEDKQGKKRKPMVLNKIQFGRGNIKITDNGSPVFDSKVNAIKVDRVDAGEQVKIRGLEVELGKSQWMKEDGIISFDKLLISEGKNLLALQHLWIGGESPVKVDTLYSGTLNVNKLINDQVVTARELQMRNIDIKLNSKNKAPSTSEDFFQNIKSKVNKDLKDIDINRLIVANASLTTSDGLKVEKVDLDIRGIRIAEGQRWRRRIPFAERLTAGIAKIHVQKVGKKFELKGVSVDSRADAISIDHFAYNKGNNHITIPGINTSMPDIYDLMDHKKISLASLKLIRPTFDLTQSSGKGKQKVLADAALDDISVGKLTISRGSFDLHRPDKRDITLDNFDLSLSHVHLDKQTDLSKQVQVFDDISFSIPNIKIEADDKLNTITIDKVSLNSSGKASLRLDNIKVKPVGQNKFFAAKKYETDWITASIKKVDLSGVDLNKLLNHQHVDSDNLLIDGARLEVYRDKNMPDAPPKKKEMYHVMLKEYKDPINIKRIDIRNSHIRYTEFAEGALQPGNITFEEFSAVCKNVTNRKDLLRVNPSLTIDAQAKVMGEANLDLSMSFDMTASDGAFTIGGKLDATPLRIFNDITNHNANIDIREGQASSLFFSAKANEKVAYGTMEFRYEDLKIIILRKPDERNTGESRSVLSFFANTFVINKNNPHLFRFRDGKIYFERDPNKSIFNYWTKTFLSGLVASIGVNNNKKEFEKAINADNDDQR